MFIFIFFFFFFEKKVKKKKSVLATVFRLLMGSRVVSKVVLVASANNELERG